MYSEVKLDRIFSRSNGICHLCHQPLDRARYGNVGLVGGWEVDHSRPRAAGGTDHLNNLYPAHIGCNRDKGTATSRAVRKRNGMTRPPRSMAAFQKAKAENAFLGGVLGTIIGGMVGGPGGMVVMAISCAAMGSRATER